jgi:hypothetical protein
MEHEATKPMTGPAGTANSNGRFGLLPWIVGTATTALLGVGTGTINTVHSNTNRISVLEANVLDHREKLAHIEQKIDQLLEYQHRQRP